MADWALIDDPLVRQANEQAAKLLAKQAEASKQASRSKPEASQQASQPEPSGLLPGLLPFTSKPEASQQASQLTEASQKQAEASKQASQPMEASQMRVERARKGGQARAAALSAERRREIALKANTASHIKKSSRKLIGYHIAPVFEPVYSDE